MRGQGPWSFCASKAFGGNDRWPARRILKAGGAYLPLDPSYPRERLAFMLGDAGAPVLVTQSTLADAIPDAAARLVRLDDDAALIAQRPGTAPALSSDLERVADPLAGDAAQRAAYVIYTSGSTGTPKGVVVTHGALNNFLAAMAEQVPLVAADRMLAVTTIGFDIAALELYLPLLHGASVVVAPRPTVQDAAALRQAIAASGATVMQATPTLWQTLLTDGGVCAGDLAGLSILTGGETLPAELARSLSEHGRSLTNLYGPTETTIWSAATMLDGSDDSVPLGRPIWNTQLYVLDGSLGPVPSRWWPASSTSRGAGLARGYLNREGLTAERFVADPHGGLGARMLLDRRPGLRWRHDEDATWSSWGGRMRRSKLRGFPHRARRDRGCAAQRSARTAWRGPPCQWCARTAGRPAADRLREERLRRVLPSSNRRCCTALGRHLPDYMVPAAIVLHWRLCPLTPNGKLDRRRPCRRRSLRQVARSTGRTACLVRGGDPGIELFANEVLGVPRVGVDDQLLRALGGRSLLATRLISRVRMALDVEVGIRSLFEAPASDRAARAEAPSSRRR